MDKGKNNLPSDNDENDLVNEITKKLQSNLADFNSEYRINLKNMNIDSLEEDSKDSDSVKIEIEDEKEKGFIKKILHKLKAAWNGYISISKANLIYPMLFIIGTIIYLEVVAHCLIFQNLDITIICPILFAIPFGTLIGFITGLFSPIINKILLWIFTGIICLIFSLQLIYHYVFKVFFSFQSLGMAGDAVTNFGSDIVVAIKANIVGLLLLVLPLIVLAIISKYFFEFTKRGLKLQVIMVGATAIFHTVAVVALLLFGRGDYTPYDLYHNSKVQDLCGKELGITTMTRIDISRLMGDNEDLVLVDTISYQPGTDLTPSVEPTIPPIAPGSVSIIPNVTLAPTPIPIDTSPNIMDIDFAALAKDEDDDNIKTLDNYFASVAPTNKNEYTGMFKGYNLILITAEGFSPYAINEEKTPTLYKLSREGFVFNNFYTALWQTSTSDGEYVALNGLIPAGTRNMYLGRNNLWPFALGNQFDQLGVESKAYHNHTYTYYERNETHPNLGYIFKAKGNGLNLDNPDVWPASDLDMINNTVDEYINEDQFHVYYLTVSGHMNYSFTGNSMSLQNKSLVEDLPYSDDVKAYIACQIELDRALEELITRLEEANVADRTVIALSADHYPYGWDKSILDEAAGHVVEPNFETYKNNFILWSKGMTENIVIDEPCSSMDILPTLSNLFGLEYDSRLLMGQDILSDAPPLVILANRSFITDKVMYNSETGEVTNLTSEELPEDYVSNMNKIIKNKFVVSKSILEEDYYRCIFGEDKE